VARHQPRSEERSGREHVLDTGGEGQRGVLGEAQNLVTADAGPPAGGGAPGAPATYLGMNSNATEKAGVA